MASMDKVIVRSHKQNTNTGPYPYKNSGQIARADKDQIGKMKTFKNTPFIEDGWPTKFAANPKVRSASDAPYTGKRNHVTEEQ
jgi:hypothetical protein